MPVVPLAAADLPQSMPPQNRTHATAQTQTRRQGLALRQTRPPLADMNYLTSNEDNRQRIKASNQLIAGIDPDYELLVFVHVQQRHI